MGEPGVLPSMGSHSQTRLKQLSSSSILFSIVAVSIYIPNSSVGGFPSLYILSSVCCFGFFDGGHLDWCIESLNVTLYFCLF